MKGTGPARFLLIGIGPFAKRTYIPHLLALEQEGRANLLAAVDVLSNQDKLIKYQQVGCPNVELLFVPHFTLDMPEIVQAALTELVDRLGNRKFYSVRCSGHKCVTTERTEGGAIFVNA